jgi:UMF1 family MFS transporter
VNVKVKKRSEAGRGEIFAWCWYDFSNSAFVTVVVTVVGGVFFTQLVCSGAKWAEFLWGTALSASAAMAMLAGPLVGRWADRKASKKPLLVGLTLLCVAATSLMGLPVWGVAAVTGLVVVANACFLLGENLVAAFLPELAPPGKRGKISAYGWGFGYVGGLASLGLALWILSGAEGSVRKVFPAVAGFMVLAALPTILFLKERAKPGRESVTEPDWRAVWSTIRDRSELRRLLLGLGASLTGLSAVVGFASIYATKEIGFTLEDTVKLFVVLQVAAVVGALVTGPWQDRSGARPVLLSALGLWVLVSVGAWLSRSAGSFYAVAALAGLGMGWLQSAGRAAVAEITPQGQQGEVFGLWGFAGKLAGIVGPLTFGALAGAMGLREAVLINGVWFFLGAWILGRDKD